MDRHVADTEFNGAWLPVYETPTGRQYVVDADGKQVFDSWHMSPEEWAAMFPQADRPTILDRGASLGRPER